MIGNLRRRNGMRVRGRNGIKLRRGNTGEEIGNGRLGPIEPQYNTGIPNVETPFSILKHDGFASCTARSSPRVLLLSYDYYDG